MWQIFYLGQIAGCIFLHNFYLRLHFPVFQTNLYGKVI